MSLPSIDFKSIREHRGNRANGFEELCCQLAALEQRPANAIHIRKGLGADAGVECFTQFADGREMGWQVKYYQQMDDNAIRNLDDSVQTALKKHPKLDTYVVCLPIDLSDSRIEGVRTALNRWDGWRLKWVAQAEADGRSLDIKLWSAADLRERLTRDDPRYAGRLLYWFDLRHMTAQWFRKQFDRTKADLGQRYTAETSVSLDIRRVILGLARDPWLGREVERWRKEIGQRSAYALQELSLYAGHAATPTPTGIEEALQNLNAAVSISDVGSTTLWPTERWSQKLDEAVDATRTTLGWCFHDDTDGSKEGKEAHEHLQHALWELRNALQDIQAALTEPLWSHVNDRAVLVHGEGGVGKSHLLADVAAYQIANERPVLMLLGQHFANDDPWPQIVRRLDLPAVTSTEAFLGALDAAGEASGVRALLLIDALNENYGTRLWQSRLAGFLQDIERFPHIAVVVSCRTTYLQVVIPEDMTEARLPRLKHRGFGNDDVRAYLKARHFVLPGAPFPAPEFAIPLFLKTCCDALEKQGLSEFPRGVLGTTALFDFYTSAVATAVNRRLGLEERRRIVPKAVKALANLMIEAGNEWVPVEAVHACFDTLFGRQLEKERDVLAQLESEGMLTVEAGTGGDASSGDGTVEVVRFTFQRFSDHVLASHLFNAYLDTDEPAQAFADGGPLHDLVTGERGIHLAGVLEAMAVQLPELCGKELPDLAPDNSIWWVREAFRHSLLWRDQKTFTQRTLDLVGELLGEHEVLPTLLSVATEPDNVFNAWHLHEWLLSLPMPERDNIWSIEIAQIAEETNGPVETLIDWAWTSGAGLVEDRRAELAGITLTWLLTTSHRLVRDRATKALANLLTPRPVLVRTLLDRFWGVDDDYLRERLLAAVYGALLQGQWTADATGAVVTHVHGLLFDPGPPPVNVLLRDHGRGIVEYALARDCLPEGLDPVDARPPYSSPWPLEHVPDEVVDGYRRTSGRAAGHRDAIVSSSARDGDFARYVIDPYVSDWSPAPIGCTLLPTDEEVWTQWREAFEPQASPEARAALDHLLVCEAAVAGKGIGEKTAETEAFDDAQRAFRAAISPSQWEDFRSCSGIWLRTGMFSRYFGHGAACFDLSWARRWVCWRAHALGWSEDLHGEFDQGPLVSNDRMTHTVERIGKKYQWLALYELGARLADNCAFIGERYGDLCPGKYDGESSARQRNIDPSLLLSGTRGDSWTEFEEKCWWAPIRPHFVAQSTEERVRWLYSERDWIDSSACIDVVARDGRSWLVLNTFASSREQSSNSPIESERDTWSRVSCFVVEKAVWKPILGQIQKRILTDPSALPKINAYSGRVYLGEYPWHPGWVDLEENIEIAVKGASTPVKPTVAMYLCERGTYDASVAQSVNVTLPAPWLMQAMGLHLSDGRRATFDDADEVTLFCDPSLKGAGPQAGLVDREAFLAALDRSDLAPVWVIAGEKGLYGGMGDRFGGRRDFTTVYWLEDGTWQHHRHEEFHAPTRHQMETLLGGPVPAWIQLQED